MMRSERRRSPTTLLLAGFFLLVLSTGVLNYIQPYSPLIADAHTSFSFLFVLVLAVHILNNLRPFRHHLGQRRLTLYLTLAVLLIGLAIFLKVPGFGLVADLGYALRSVDRSTEDDLTVITQAGTEHHQLEILAIAGSQYLSQPIPLFLGLTFVTEPQTAIWLEDLKGNYLKTIYLTHATADSSYTNEESLSGGVVRRPESLPYWAHKRNIRARDGLLMPMGVTTDVDAISAATPKASYLLKSVAKPSQRRFRVMAEINRSFDFNAFWHPHRFPDDPVYSGSGKSGQPSLIYSSEIDLDSGETVYPMRPIGHGHHSGQDGKLYPDLSGFDSALEIISMLIVRIAPPPSKRP